MSRHDKKMKEWQASGECKSAFATRHGIGRSTFYHWTKHLKVSVQPKRAQSFEFIPIDETEASLDIKPAVVIHYSSDTRLELYTSLDVRHLKTLIK